MLLQNCESNFAKATRFHISRICHVRRRHHDMKTMNTGENICSYKCAIFGGLTEDGEAVDVTNLLVVGIKAC